jgi:nucleoside-diphosphate-sugar epimerase
MFTLEKIVRILITGVTGFIGSHLFEHLARENTVVAGFVRNAENNSPERALRLAQLNNIARECPNATILTGPRFGEMERDVAEFSPTACVHLAGRSSVRESFSNPGLYATSNAAATIELLEILRRAGCLRVIHSSSVMIYGKDAPLPYTESGIGSTPASFYGASKLATETFVNTWRVLHGMEAINLRLFSVYGPELRPDCVPHLIASAIRDDRDFTIFGDGSSVRDYVEIDDVVRAIQAAIHTPWSKSFPLALNIGSGIGTALIELVRIIERGMNKKARLVHKSAVRSELQAVVAGIDLARTTLQWEPRVELKDGMARLTNWFAQTRSTH